MEAYKRKTFDDLLASPEERVELINGEIVRRPMARSEHGIVQIFDQAAEAFQLARSWFVAQPIPLKLVSGAAAFAVLWVFWILLRVILVALRAAFRGL